MHFWAHARVGWACSLGAERGALAKQSGKQLLCSAERPCTSLGHTHACTQAAPVHTGARSGAVRSAADKAQASCTRRTNAAGLRRAFGCRRPPSPPSFALITSVQQAQRAVAPPPKYWLCATVLFVLFISCPQVHLMPPCPSLAHESISRPRVCPFSACRAPLSLSAGYVLRRAWLPSQSIC